MNPEISHSIFGKARDRYDNAMKIAFFGILALLLFHITTFQPFIGASARLSRVQAENETLHAVQPKLVAIQGGLVNLNKRTGSLIDNALGQTMMLTAADFVQLNERVASILHGESGDLPSPAEPRVSPQMQSRDEPMQMHAQTMAPQAGLMVQNTLAAEPPFRQLPAIEDAVARQIKQAGSVKDLRTLLLPYVKANIIEVRFPELNRELQARSGPLKVQAEEIRDSAASLPRSLSDYSESFEKVAQDMNQFVQMLDALSIQPPENDRWWTSVQSKIAAKDALAADAESSLSKHLNTQRSDRILDDLQETIERNEAVKAGIEEQLNTLEQQFESQQEQFQKLVSSMNWGILNLKPFAAKFPIFLGLFLMIISLMLSRRINELSTAISTMPADDQPELRQWLRRRVDMTGDTLFFDKVMSKDSMIAFASLGWIAISSWQVSNWEDVGTQNAALMYGLAVPMIAFALWYRKRVLEGLARDA